MRSTRIIPCHYTNPDPKIQKLGDLKVEYAMTQSRVIKSLFKQAEDLILFNMGTKETLISRINNIHTGTNEEKCFFYKLKKLLRRVK